MLAPRHAIKLFDAGLLDASDKIKAADKLED